MRMNISRIFSFDNDQNIEPGGVEKPRPSIPTSETCVMCPRRGRLCSECLDARCCSVECQKLDRKNHKRLCKKFKDSQSPPKHCRALFFAGGDKPPRFVYIEIGQIRDHDKDETFDQRRFFGSLITEHKPVYHNTVQSRDFYDSPREGLKLIMKEDVIQDSANNAAKAFTRAGVGSWALRGPLLVMHYREKLLPSQRTRNMYLDITMRDVRYAADMLTVFNRNGTSDADLAHREQNRHNEEHLQFSDIVRNGCDEVFKEEGSGIANMLGIPLFIRKYKSIKGGKGEFVNNGTLTLLSRDVATSAVTKENIRGGPIMIRGEPARGMYSGEKMYWPEYGVGRFGFGTHPSSWDRHKVEEVLLVRADGLRLLPQHAEAMVAYVTQVVEPKLAEARNGLIAGEVVESHEEILKSITMESFIEYWEHFKLTKSKTGCKWDKVPSPYEIAGDVLDKINEHAEELWKQQIDA